MTHLLIATKQLLETLTQWSRHNATEHDVSDVYVRLGYEFNIACRAFTSIGVDTSDLGPVPDLLRLILEETLSQEASPSSLDNFLPRIRDIIINLLHGLKRKQQRLRTRQAKEGIGVPGSSARQASLGSVGNDTSLTQMLEETQKHSSRQGGERRTRSGGGSTLEEQVVPPARTSSIPQSTAAGREDAPARTEQSPSRSSLREKRQMANSSLSNSSLSSETMQTIPVLSPDDYKLPIQRTSGLSQPISALNSGYADPPPPPPPPKQTDALAALQQGGELGRRASRRYSAYQISKHLGPSTNGVPMIPPAQNSPIPNRGRDVKESLNAVRSRSSLVLARRRSSRVPEGSPTRGTAVNRIAEESGSDTSTPQKQEKAKQNPDSPLAKTPEDKLGASPFAPKTADEPALSATSNGPLADSYPEEDSSTRIKSTRPEPRRLEADPGTARTSSSDGRFTPDQSPQPGKELTLFLQYKSKVKKFVMPDGANELSFARLQLAFIEKFAWNTHSNGNDLPEIYVQDPMSGVRHELESLSDVKERTVLVLNVEPLDEVKKHVDEGLGGLQKIIETVKTSIEGQQVVINQVSQRQQEAAKELARIASAPSQPVFTTRALTANSAATAPSINGVGPVNPQSLDEVQTLRRDLAILKQTVTSFNTGMASSMAAIRAKAESIKAKAVDVEVPQLEGDSGRAYVNNGKGSVSDQSEKLLSRVDDLQDHVEDLRKDVLIRGVRPRPRQLEEVNKDISSAAKDLKKYQELVKKEKPVWTKIWEAELQTVCADREFLTLQEDIITDLDEDLENVTSTLRLIEDAVRQQHALQAGEGAVGAAAAAATLRNLSRELEGGAPVDPMRAKDGVLGEVRALQPNHASRLEAIERAERARERELALRREGAAFKRELGAFVDEGRLRKSGGIEETERLRRAQDERNLKDEWQSQAARKAARQKAREAERAAQKAAQDAGQVTGDGEGAAQGEVADVGDGTDEMGRPGRSKEANGVGDSVNALGSRAETVNQSSTTDSGQAVQPKEQDEGKKSDNGELNSQ